MKISAFGCAWAASSVLPYWGIAISSLPKNIFWKPPDAPGVTTAATDGVVRPACGVDKLNSSMNGQDHFHVLETTKWHRTA